MKKIIFAFHLLNLFLLFSCDSGPKGAESPQALIKAAAGADGKADKLKALYYWKNAEEEANIDAVLSLLELKEAVDAFLKKGEARFGEEFQSAYGMGTFVLTMMTRQTPYDKLSEGGEFEIKGDSATATIVTTEGNTTSTTVAHMIKNEGFWYFPAPTARGIKTPVEMTAAMKTFFNSSQKALDESKDIEAFKKEISNVMEVLSK